MRNVIGEGAFSQVYKVLSKDSKETYAAKVIKHKQIYSDPRGPALIKLEIDVLRRVDHPNIARLVEVHEVQGAVVIVLEYA